MTWIEHLMFLLSWCVHILELMLYFLNSKRATDLWCTWSGPSAIRRVRTRAKNLASRVSPETPIPPNAWTEHNAKQCYNLAKNTLNQRYVWYMYTKLNGVLPILVIQTLVNSQMFSHFIFHRFIYILELMLYFLNSKRATDLWCTWSGPSAIRRVRTCAKALASLVSPETPIPP